MNTRHVLAGIAASVGALALAGSIASPASAAPNVVPQALSNCPNGQVCTWINGPFVGAPTVYGAPTFRNLNPSDHDEVSSWANKTSFTYCLIDFEGAGGTEPVTVDVLSPGGAHGTLGSRANDSADAIQRCG